MKIKIKSITTKKIVPYIAEFARVSRDRDEAPTTIEKDLARCKQLWKDFERTPFESIYIDFLIENVSRSLLAQITRYRHMTFNVESQRYVKIKDENNFIVPNLTDATRYEFAYAMQDAAEHYKNMLSKGAKPEDARAVLPNATPTRFRVVMNLREFVHFYSQRSTSHAQKEIRDLAGMMFRALYDIVDGFSHNLLAYMEESLKHTLKDLITTIDKLDHKEEVAEELYTKIMDIIKEYKEFV